MLHLSRSPASCGSVAPLPLRSHCRCPLYCSSCSPFRRRCSLPPSLPLSPSLVMLMSSATNNAQLQPMIGRLACADADEDLHVSLRVLPSLQAHSETWQWPVTHRGTEDIHTLDDTRTNQANENGNRMHLPTETSCVNTLGTNTPSHGERWCKAKQKTTTKNFCSCTPPTQGGGNKAIVAGVSAFKKIPKRENTC